LSIDGTLNYQLLGVTFRGEEPPVCEPALGTAPMWAHGQQEVIEWAPCFLMP